MSQDGDDLKIGVCRNCFKHRRSHAGDKCLFLPTSYAPIELSGVSPLSVSKILTSLQQEQASIVAEIQTLEQLNVDVIRAMHLIDRIGCPHTHPDGSTAWVDMFPYQKCQLCGVIG